jgi:hypothetical protein
MARLAVASVGGLVVLASGVMTIAAATGETLAILVIATIGLWAAATVRHASLRAAARRPSSVPLA